MDQPEYLKQWRGLSVRVGDRLEPAPDADVAVARAYPSWPDKGAIHDGARITILTARTSYAPGEPVRVLHVAEVVAPGRSVFVMGPKAIAGESVDGTLVTAPAPDTATPLAPTGDYDGRALPSPAVDYNYDITTYTFDTPGTHEIRWALGALRSNTLTIHVAAR